MPGAVILCIAVLLATVPAMLAHELARATVALLLTRGQVYVLLGGGRLLAAVCVGRLTIGPAVRFWSRGECLHAPAASPRRAAVIALAGPLAADLCFVAAAALAATWRDGAVHHPTIQLALWLFALVCLVRATLEVAGQLLVGAHTTRLGRQPATR